MFPTVSKDSKGAILCLLISWGLTSLVVLGNVTHTVLQLEVSKAECRGCLQEQNQDLTSKHPGVRCGFTFL